MNQETFVSWLLKQNGRDDPIGDLSCDISRDKSFPSNTASFNDVKSYFEGKSVCAEVIEALNEAYSEYRIQQLTATNARR